MKPAPVEALLPVIDQLVAALADRYTIERELAAGGMARVFVAREVALDRMVVIKVITPDLAQGLSADRFAREVRVAARLQQANIVPLLNAGTAGDLPYFTMPFVRGESLRHRIRNGPPVATAEATSLLRDVARALAYAHAEGVVHRDIKPENILLSGGAAMVTDFGIAKAVDVAKRGDQFERPDNPDDISWTGLTQAGTSLGTPAYMAPEQALGDEGVDHRADLYAWGVVAWELLAGAHPFAGRSTMQAQIAAHLAETPAPIATRVKGLPTGLAKVVMQCLEKDPARRPASADAVLAALDGDIAAAPVAARSRNSRRVAGVAVGLVCVAVIVALAARGGHRTAMDRSDKSLAVIPFEVTGGDTATAYLGEGIADEVTNTLSQLPGLRLAGRSSSARFAGHNDTPQAIGTSLHVSTVLDGTVRRAGDQIRVTAELLDARDGNVIWHENYQRAATGVFAVQDDIARAIAGQLQVTLGQDASRAIDAGGTRDPVAYDLYLKGMYLYRHRGPGIVDAIATLEQATARDSTFARAWAALSNALTVSTSYTDTRDGDALPRAQRAAERAVRLDSMLSDAHLALGYVDADMFRWPEAEAELRRAIALDPGSSDPLYRLGYTLSNQERLTEAIPVLRRAEAVDPLYFLPAAYLGWAEVNSGQVAEGIDDIRRALVLEPQSIASLCFMALGYDRAGKPDSARAYAREILGVSSQPARIGVAAYVLARNGARDEATALLRQLLATPPAAWTRWTALTLAYAGLGDSTKALDALEHATAGDGDAFPLYGLRVAHNLPGGPKFAAAMRRYHLDPATFTDEGGPRRP